MSGPELLSDGKHRTWLFVGMSQLENNVGSAARLPAPAGAQGVRARRVCLVFCPTAQERAASCLLFHPDLNKSSQTQAEATLKGSRESSTAGLSPGQEGMDL